MPLLCRAYFDANDIQISNPQEFANAISQNVYKELQKDARSYGVPISQYIASVLTIFYISCKNKEVMQCTNITDALEDAAINVKSMFF